MNRSLRWFFGGLVDLIGWQDDRLAGGAADSAGFSAAFVSAPALPPTNAKITAATMATTTTTTPIASARRRQ
ncbi:hypothetical protein L831_0394 [Mycobacteroides abscessus MAB_082312_2272]|nr:hypothetical protein L831_0394 [Mycobacteroides abscessus MAB_082312_2272]